MRRAGRRRSSVVGYVQAMRNAWALMSARATAQDIPGLEVCTTEKQMERRTGCLQGNDQYLQQALSKLARETEIAASAAPLA
jgi:hypothetical protein